MQTATADVTLDPRGAPARDSFEREYVAEIDRPTLIAAIILNFNGLADTRRAMRSLDAVRGIPMSTIVIDNGSDVNETPTLKAEFPAAYVERLEENLGYGRGANYAARLALKAGATHLLLLNSDAWLQDDGATLRLLLNELTSDTSIVAAGPLVANDDALATIQSAGYRYSLWWPVPRAIRTFGKPCFISGCCMLIVADRFAELGGFDPDLFLYGEDLEFALRAKKCGYRLAIVPAASVRHRRGGSSKILSNRYVYTTLRSNLIVIRKHAKWYNIPSAAVASIAVSFGLAIFAFFAGNRNAAKAVYKAWLDFGCGRWGGLEGSPLTPARRPSLEDRQIFVS